ncbi:MAG: MltA domain-containing protein [Cyanobacteria bacterium J06623_4]
MRTALKVFTGAFTLSASLILTPGVSFAEETSAETSSVPPLVELETSAARAAATESIGQDTPLFEAGSIEADNAFSEKQALLEAIGHSLRYFRSLRSLAAYRDYPIEGITHSRVRDSLLKFRTLLIQSQSAAELQQAVAAEFDLHQAIGQDEAGTVAFTGYFEPTYAASLAPSADYRYPIYQQPPDLDQWPEPHPTRAALEGTDGLQADQGPLKGLELAWLPSRIEAFLIQVQGSARLELADGSTFSVGYDGRTNYPYSSIGRALIDDGIIPEDELSLPILLDYFDQNPEALDSYLPRNDRFVFFRATDGAPATGSLGYPVTAGRSIATDKSIMPPGALALITLPLPQRSPDGTLESSTTARFVLDQDTGGAIKGPGRVDLFVGTGAEAGEVAGVINNTGALYYLLLKE